MRKKLYKAGKHWVAAAVAIGAVAVTGGAVSADSASTTSSATSTIAAGSAAPTSGSVSSASSATSSSAVSSSSATSSVASSSVVDTPDYKAQIQPAIEQYGLTGHLDSVTVNGISVSDYLAAYAGQTTPVKVVFHLGA